MKHHTIFNRQLFFAFVFMIGLNAFGQKYMKVNEVLKSVAQPQMISQKGFKAIPYYRFGQFEVIESKAGFSKTKTVGSGNIEVGTQEQKLRFTLVNKNAGDTIKVDMEKQGRFAETQAFFRNITFSNGDVNVVSDLSCGGSEDWKRLRAVI